MTEYPYFMIINSCMRLIHSSDCLSCKLNIEYTKKICHIRDDGQVVALNWIRQKVLAYNPDDKR